MTLPGIPSIYYGGEWGTEGKRTSTCDDDLRPCIPAEKIPQLNCELTDLFPDLERSMKKTKSFTTENIRNCFLPTGSMPTQDGEITA